MVPIDLTHTEKLTKALDTAKVLAQAGGGTIILVGVTSTAPGAAAHTPEEFSKKLSAFGSEYAERSGCHVETSSFVANDPATDLHKTLIDASGKLVDASGKLDVDLIVMASHVPGLPEHIFSSNAGSVASHAGISVLVVR